MKNIVFKNGLISVAIIMGIQLITYLVYGLPNSSNFDRDEIIGYISIVACLLFVFFGIREYVLLYSKGSFLKYLGIGAAISLFPSMAFGAYSVVYYKWINPNFLKEYGDYQIEKLKSTLPADEFEVAKSQFMEEMALWDSVSSQFIIMFLTVFVIGLIISTLSALYFQLKTSKNG
ncbi:DUF4199 domain-containing protein [Fulvivirga lutea]|uniref:DUF4199 domain-containing protein n=1 Tax=Fulvivirga lutea TaxID=2810512 RepID=A0A974WDX9_9BACT|nr:DUF4199 domain-containing protein [Fulvivirga lutea]QSE96418.1 DUF4199 domain-containing protein [Fulvivirga lutea]